MLSNQEEQALVRYIESIAVDIGRIANKLASTVKPETSHSSNRYHIARLSTKEKYWCDCGFDFFRHTLQGFECHRCLKFYSMDDFAICTDPMRLELC